jgi:hypothetical protein
MSLGGVAADFTTARGLVIVDELGDFPAPFVAYQVDALLALSVQYCVATLGDVSRLKKFCLRLILPAGSTLSISHLPWMSIKT